MQLATHVWEEGTLKSNFNTAKYVSPLFAQKKKCQKLEGDRCFIALKEGQDSVSKINTFGTKLMKIEMEKE